MIRTDLFIGFLFRCFGFLCLFGFFLIWLHSLSWSALFLYGCRLSGPLSALDLILSLFLLLLLPNPLNQRLPLLLHNLLTHKLLRNLISIILTNKRQILIPLIAQNLRFGGGQQFRWVTAEQECMGELVDPFDCMFEFLDLGLFLFELFLGWTLECLMGFEAVGQAGVWEGERERVCGGFLEHFLLYYLRAS